MKIKVFCVEGYDESLSCQRKSGTTPDFSDSSVQVDSCKAAEIPIFSQNNERNLTHNKIMKML